MINIQNQKLTWIKNKDTEKYFDMDDQDQKVAVTSYHRSWIKISSLSLFVTTFVDISGFIYLYTFDRARLRHVIKTMEL